MKFSIFATILLLASPAFSIVDMKNANFSNTWVDLEVPGTGYDLKITRTYNSKTLFEGMFGFGWCSDYETRLSITAEGNLKLTECGAGQEVYYFPRQFGQKDIEAMVQKIVAKVKAAKKIDEKRLKQFTEDLRNDSDLRSAFASSYKISQGLKEGTQYYANGREVETMVYSKNIFTRTMPDGSSMRFDQNGLMTHMYDKNGNFIKIDYAKDGTISQVSDNNARKLSFKYFTNKKVQSIVGPSGMTSEYKFKNLNDLIWVKTAWKSIYTFEYDGSHNMVKAGYPDKTSIALTYDTKNDWVTSFTDREKCNEKYTYEFSEKNPKMNYWATVKKVCGKEVVNESKHEFWYSERKDGQTYLQRVASTVNGNVTDITYHEVFGKPVSIRRNEDRYQFEYFPNGQVKIKKSPLARLTFKYDTASKKVSEVFTEALNEKGKVSDTRKTNFKYDKKGNLTFAQNSDGQTISMTYDLRGRIATITDQAKKIVKIDYENRFGKPSVVTRPGLGAIQVSYKPNGEIEKVVSPEGPTVAMQVASTFNNLLDIIAPATAEVFN